MDLDPERISGSPAVYQFHVSGEEGGTFQVRLENQQAEISEGTPYKSDCTLEMSAEHLIQLIEGQLNPTTAFMLGKLKVNGSLGQAMKLQGILKQYSM
jgi:putative sterol carrier protein